MPAVVQTRAGLKARAGQIYRDLLLARVHVRLARMMRRLVPAALEVVAGAQPVVVVALLLPLLLVVVEVVLLHVPREQLAQQPQALLRL